MKNGKEAARASPMHDDPDLLALSPFFIRLIETLLTPVQAGSEVHSKAVIKSKVLRSFSVCF